MADNIVDIAFTDVTILENVSGTPFSASITGTLEVNYTTGAITNCALTASGSGFPTTTFTNATLTAHSHGQFEVNATSGINNTLQFTYTHFEPNHLFFLELTLGSFSPIFVGPPFLHNSLSSTPVCFVEGTLIRTPRGDVPVETLKIGDLVVTASGEVRPVKWMGHRDVDFRLTPNASPRIRIAAGAFGASRPSQDLYLSAGHSVCVNLLGEVFIPVGYLVNGATIARVETDEITYWHVELDSHDILIANNLPAESYLAMGNRGAFEELRGLLPAMLEGRERTHADFCRPVVTRGPVLDFARKRLLARAEEIGWTPSREAELCLAIDGEIVRPLVEDGAAAFLFPASLRDVRLLSNAFSPAALGSGDPRTLGVMLFDLSFSGGHGEVRQISLGDERLRDGIHQLEDHCGGPRRWTNGNLALDPQLWDGVTGPVALHVTYDTTTIRGWNAPAGVSQKTPSDRPRLRVVA